MADDNDKDGDGLDFDGVVVDLEQAREVKEAEQRQRTSSGSAAPAGGGDQAATGGSKGRREPNKSTTLCELAHATDMELWLSKAGHAYATIPVELKDRVTGQKRRHFENVALKDERFKEFLTEIFDEATGNAPGAQPLADAIILLTVDARKSGNIYPTYIRVGERVTREGGPIEDLWIDLGDAAWRAIRVTAAGWSIEPGDTAEKVPVKFLRTGAMEPLPLPPLEPADEPDRGESSPLSPLAELINPNISEEDFKLIVGWIVGAFHPRGPYAALAIDGEQGSGKSSLSRIVRRLVDPNEALVRSAPKDVGDLSVQAENAWVVSLDNQSSLPGWLSDALCRLATGAGLSTRELYTNKREVVFSAKRPILLNGISRVASSFDLADRCVMINLPPLEEERYVPEGQLHARFAEKAGEIFGAILDGLVWAVRDHGAVDPVPTRMVDFAMWVEAAAPGLGWERGEFSAAYLARRGEVVETGLKENPVASAIVQLMEECLQAVHTGVLPEVLRAVLREPRDAYDPDKWSMVTLVGDVPGAPEKILWQSTPTDLLAVLMKIGGDPENKSKTWPATNSLWDRITRAMPLLRKRGIKVTRGKSGDRRYTVERPYEPPRAPC